jgi:hypothetical protein
MNVAMLDTFTDIPFSKKSKKIRIPQNMLSRGFVEFEVSLQISIDITSNVRFTYSDFGVSIAVYAENC